MGSSIPISMEVMAVVFLCLTLLCGLLIGYFLGQRNTRQEREERIRLTSELDAADKANQEQRAVLTQARQELSDSFSALAGTALKQNSNEFLKLASENLARFQTQAKGELGAREKAVEELIKPIRETLEKTEREVRLMEKERREAYGSLNKQLEGMAESQRLLQGETRNLVQALRRPEVRGQWGEMTLKRLAELAGMVEHCDFDQQQQVHDDEGKGLRPDMIVRMPDKREIVVDAKTPLDAYLDAIDATDDASRQQALERHSRNVRKRVRELAAKNYWQQFANAPDFVVLFIPGEQFLHAALDIDHKLLEDAMADKVILSTPTSFVALLRAVAYGWRQEALAENAEKIRQIGEQMYGRLATFSDHLGKLGKSLEGSVSHFNRAIGSYDSRIVPSARKFAELGISSKTELDPPDQIETAVRTLESSQDVAGEP